MTDSVVNLPIPESASAKDFLAAASRRPFDDVLILGTYADGELRHASTMTRERQLWLIESYRLMLLGLIDGANVK